MLWKCTDEGVLHTQYTLENINNNNKPKHINTLTTGIRGLGGGWCVCTAFLN